MRPVTIKVDPPPPGCASVLYTNNLNQVVRLSVKVKCGGDIVEIARRMALIYESRGISSVESLRAAGIRDYATGNYESTAQPPKFCEDGSTGGGSSTG